MNQSLPIRAVLLVGCALLLVAPSVQAQLDQESFSVEAAVPAVFDPVATNRVPVNVTLSCSEVLEKAGEADVTVALGETLDGVVAQSVPLHFGLEDCAGATSVTKAAVLEVDAAEAPGLEPFTLPIQAVLGDHTAQAEYEERSVDYRPGHAFEPAGDQEFMVTGARYEFDLVIQIDANADTMVMFEDKVVSGRATVTGLRAQTFDIAGEAITASNLIAFTAPDSNWTTETVTFRTYSHCLGGPDCPPQDEQTITWTFVNAAPAADGPAGPADAKESPPFAPMVIVLSVVALAALGRRRTR